MQPHMPSLLQPQDWRHDVHSAEMVSTEKAQEDSPNFIGTATNLVHPHDSTRPGQGSNQEISFFYD